MVLASMLLKYRGFDAPGAQQRLRDSFGQHGITGDRFLFSGQATAVEMMRTYAQIDIGLDPFPYSGGLTTCEALWMGVPTVTMPGETFASRHSASHMSNAGLPDWVVEGADAYVARALASVADIDALAQLRTGLRAQARASPLCDAPRFGRSLGAALRHAWRGWCATQAG